MGVGPHGELIWEDEDDAAPKPRRRLPRGSMRTLILLAAWLWLFPLAGIVADVIGAGAGYLVVLLAVAIGAWRADRFFAKGYWGGDREWRG